MRSRALPVLVLLLHAGCGVEPIFLEGQFGRRIALASGDASPLPRLMFIDEGCPGPEAVGGCPAGGDRICQPVLIDTLTPITALKAADDVERSRVQRECLEVRAAAGLVAPQPDPEDLEAAVARFRFDNVPVIRAPAAGKDDWNWLAGDADNGIDPSAVLGGNLLRQLSVLLRMPRRGAATVRFYSEFPGSEINLADAGRTFLPVQFPGRLLGRDLPDRCNVDGDRCELPGFDLTPGQNSIALEATRMVMDACVAMPPCALRYDSDRLDPFTPGVCSESRGPDFIAPCTRATDEELGGEVASLVVATGVPGMVLFSDSVERMFGLPDALPGCSVAAIGPDTRACLIGHDRVLHFSGWPSAGEDVPLTRLRVRSVGLVPGVVDTREVLPCQRADSRRAAALEQCNRFVEAASDAGDVRNTFPPFSANPDDEDGADHAGDLAATSLVVLGEANLPPGAMGPDPGRWIDVTIVPATHPMVLALRRDVAPEAIEPDGLLGTVLFDDTELVLDYTDPNPGLRMTCLDPRAGDCYSAPDCQTDGQPACCYGMPLELVVDWIVIGQDDTCCGALSADELAEIQQLGHCQGSAPP